MLGLADDDFLFDRAAFIQTQPRETHAFFSTFFGTQLFATYVDTKVSLKEDKYSE